MSGYVFENKGAIHFMSGKEEQKLFREIGTKFGLKRDIDIVSLCASVGLFTKHKGTFTSHIMKKTKKLVDMTSFTDRRIFDTLIIQYLGKETGRLKCFETLFYSGFKILYDWYTKKGPGTESALESFSNLMKFLSY